VAFAAEQRSLGLGLAAVPGGDDDVVALLGQRTGDGDAEADGAAGAGYEGDLHTRHRVGLPLGKWTVVHGD
jgi:hypothetical protein